MALPVLDGQQQPRPQSYRRRQYRGRFGSSGSRSRETSGPELSRVRLRTFLAGFGTFRLSDFISRTPAQLVWVVNEVDWLDRYGQPAFPFPPRVAAKGGDTGREENLGTT